MRHELARDKLFKKKTERIHQFNGSVLAPQEVADGLVIPWQLARSDVTERLGQSFLRPSVLSSCESVGLAEPPVW